MDTFDFDETQPVNGIILLPNGDYRFGELCFQTENLILKKKERKIKINYQEAVLLKMFLEARDHFLNREKTIRTLWPQDAHDRKVCDNRLNMSVRRLRISLVADRRIKISCDSKFGYTLYVVKI